MSEFSGYPIGRCVMISWKGGGKKREKEERREEGKEKRNNIFVLHFENMVI